MTLRAILGLVVLNVFLLGVGAGVLWGLRGWRWWTDLVRLAGVAYLVGVTALMTLSTLELVLGLPFSPTTIVASGIALAGSGFFLGHLKQRRRPGLRPPQWHFPALSLFSSILLGGLVVYFGALFRAARLERLIGEFDGLAVWVPKAKAIYFSGGLEPHVLASLNASYPPGMPVLHALAFHAMGSADVVTFHLEYWFLAVGFVAALFGILAPRVRVEILLPIAVAMLVMPGFVQRASIAYSDVPLGYFVVVAALLVLLWVDEQEVWQLTVATLLLAGAMLTKREGILLAVSVVLAGLAASWRDRRVLWPRLAAAGLVAFALSVPWRVWIMVRGLPGEGPEAGYFGSFGYLERVWPSLKLVGATLLDTDLWLVVPILALSAAVLAFLAGERRVAVFTFAFLGAAFVASSWAIWSNPTLPFTEVDSLNPVVRLMGTPVLVLAALTPLLLERCWSGTRLDDPVGSRARRGPDVLVPKSTWPWAIVVVAAIAYPASMLVGYSGYTLPGGLPHFPSTSDCVKSPVRGEPVRVVFGYADSYPKALGFQRRAVAAGFHKAKVAQDGCGRLRVSVDRIPSATVAGVIARQAQAAGLATTLEDDPYG